MGSVLRALGEAGPLSVLRAWILLAGSRRRLGKSGYVATREWASAAAKRLRWLGTAKPGGLSRSVRLAARLPLARCRCLGRSLALEALLRSHGLEAESRFGVVVEDGRLAAHAWVESDGAPIGEPADQLEKFAALRSLTKQSP